MAKDMNKIIPSWLLRQQKKVNQEIKTIFKRCGYFLLGVLAMTLLLLFLQKNIKETYIPEQDPIQKELEQKENERFENQIRQMHLKPEKPRVVEIKFRR